MKQQSIKALSRFILLAMGCTALSLTPVVFGSDDGNHRTDEAVAVIAKHDQSLEEPKVIDSQAVLQELVEPKGGKVVTDVKGVAEPSSKKERKTSTVINRVNDTYDLTFKESMLHTLGTATVGDQSVPYRAYEGIVYVSKPVDTTYETLNVYIPEAYFEGGTIHGYTAETAPIFMPNSVGGYMPGEAMNATDENREGGPSSIQYALVNGMVVVAPGARGRSLKNEETGEYTGKAPAAIVDLKAAVRYVKANDKVMPGDANKIISNGTSAGGALSTLLGATGDSEDYEPYLNDLGAARASDSVYAVSAYTPITNLDHANEVYEWNFNKLHTYKKMDISMLDYKVERKMTDMTMTEKEKTMSRMLASSFPSYVNGLGLTSEVTATPLRLDSFGNGTFKDYVKDLYVASANRALNEGTATVAELKETPGVIVKAGRVADINWDQYVSYEGRSKGVGAFDNVTMDTGENNEFGNYRVDNQHFTDFMYKYSEVPSTMADLGIVKMMNPMYYIGSNTSIVSKYWRIRFGGIDTDTSVAIPTILALQLQKYGYIVDYSVPWQKPHSGDYDLDDLFKWIHSIV